jgi:ketosteroid isomerase-like protein
LIAVLAALSIVSCTPKSEPLTDLMKTELENQVRDTWNQTIIAIEKSNSADYLAFFSQEGFIGMNSQGMHFESLQQYADTVNYWFGMRTENRMEQQKIKISALCEDAVILNQTCIFQPVFTNGTVMPVQHAGTFLFRKEGSGWKIIHGHESFLPI